MDEKLLEFAAHFKAYRDIVKLQLKQVNRASSLAKEFCNSIEVCLNEAVLLQDASYTSVTRMLFNLIS